MQLLERAIRLALDWGTGPMVKSAYASAKFESNEVFDKLADEKRKAIQFEASIESKLYSPSLSSPFSQYGKGSMPEMESNTKLTRVNNTPNYSKPEYVYWINNELDKW